jgi:hypothetical protein
MSLLQGWCISFLLSHKNNHTFFSLIQCQFITILQFLWVKNLGVNWVPVAHACNPSYSGLQDQEDCGSKSAQGK